MRAVPILLALAGLTIPLLPGQAEAAVLLPGHRLFWNGIAGSFGPTFGGEGPAVYGSIRLGLRLLPIVPELRLREGVAASGKPDERQVGGVAAGARVLLPAPPVLIPSFFVAFSHQHEVPMAAFRKAPLQSLFGVGEGIVHRSGFETGIGLELRPDPTGVFGIWADGTALIYPGTPGPPVTLLAEIGISLSFGPK
jgi:hypothetical protein